MLDDSEVVRITGALTEFPRYVFQHPKYGRITWLELRGTQLVIASSPPGQDTALEVDVRSYGNEPSAKREHDRLIDKLILLGYELAAVASTRDSAIPTLRSHPDLEAQLAEQPRDEATWQVYEDWLLEVRDPRAEIVELERGRDWASAEAVRGRLGYLLLGRDAGKLLARVDLATWRAGFLRHCRCDGELIEPLLATPAAQFLVELDLKVARYISLTKIAKASLVDSLRVFIDPEDSHDLDATLLQPLTRLRDLHLTSLSSLRYDDCLARIVRLHVAPHRADMRLIFGHPYPALVELELDGRRWVPPRWHFEQLTSNAPSLRTVLVSTTDDIARALLTELAASGLAKQLVRLGVTGSSLTQHVPHSAAFGGAFAHIEQLLLPRGVLESAGRA